MAHTVQAVSVLGMRGARGAGVSALGRRSACSAGSFCSEGDASKLGVTGSCYLVCSRNEYSVSLQVSPGVCWSRQYHFKGKKMKAITRSSSPPLHLEEVRKINSLPKALAVACLSLK